MKSKFRINIDVWMTVALLVLAIFMLIKTSSFPASAARFPKLTLYLTIILSIAVISESLAKSKHASRFNPGLSSEKLIPAMIIFGMVVGYFILLSLLGFTISTIIFCLSATKFMGSNNWIANVILAIGFIVFVYFAFVVFLQVSIPMWPRFIL